MLNLRFRTRLALVMFLTMACTTAALMGTVPAVVAGGIGTLLVVALWMKLFPPLRHVNKFADVSVPVA